MALLKTNFTSTKGLLKAIPAMVDGWYEVRNCKGDICAFNADTGQTLMSKCEISIQLLTDLKELLEQLLTTRTGT